MQSLCFTLKKNYNNLEFSKIRLTECLFVRIFVRNERLFDMRENRLEFRLSDKEKNRLNFIINFWGGQTQSEFLRHSIDMNFELIKKRTFNDFQKEIEEITHDNQKYKDNLKKLEYIAERLKKLSEKVFEQDCNIKNFNMTLEKLNLTIEDL